MNKTHQTSWYLIFDCIDGGQGETAYKQAELSKMKTAFPGWKSQEGHPHKKTIDNFPAWLWVTVLLLNRIPTWKYVKETGKVQVNTLIHGYNKMILFATDLNLRPPIHNNVKKYVGLGQNVRTCWFGHLWGITFNNLLWGATVPSESVCAIMQEGLVWHVWELSTMVVQ